MIIVRTVPIPTFVKLSDVATLPGEREGGGKD